MYSIDDPDAARIIYGVVSTPFEKVRIKI
jgi:hypothetical protein